MYMLHSMLLYLVVCVLVAMAILRYFLGKPKVLKDKDGNILDPIGGNRLKNLIALGMATIARNREKKKSKSETVKEIESFHKPENHPYFNESYYFNGADTTGNRFITRVSRRGAGGKVAYMFLLLDIENLGQFFIEEDNVPVDLTNDNPAAKNLEFVCIEPMKRWQVRYRGNMYKGTCLSPAELKADHSVRKNAYVEFEMIYERESPVFWYMKDDNRRTLAYNLSQEEWNLNFFKYCLTRSKNHGHYEDYGTCSGFIRIDKSDQRINLNSLATFRDHSWDIRMWQTMDSLLILLYAFKTPLKAFGGEYYYLDLTLVSMPGNLGGVQRYTTGYVLGKRPDEVLTCSAATSINDIPWRLLDNGKREPMDRTILVMQVVPQSNPNKLPPITLRLTIEGKKNRLRYWPDEGAFEVFEDYMQLNLVVEETGMSIEGYGTRQSGFRVGQYDPTKGGCG